MRAALYARYSSDRQSERSVEDQIRLCQAHAAKMGVVASQVYSDAGISGASLLTRPGIQELMRDAKAGRFDIVIAEAIDRLSRDQEDIAGLFKRLGYNNIKLHTVSEGDITELHVGLKGTMNALFLKDLAQKTKRGLQARVEDGLTTSGISYGYRKVIKLDGNGEPIRGLREVHPEQADVVRRIFKEYTSGKSPRAIARDLNGDHLLSPRGGQWNASTINGNRARKNGMLHNQLFIGKLEWNRQSFRKDPDTGKRVSIVNPASESIAVDVPHLRIIDDATWTAAQALKARYAGMATHKRLRPVHLLSGLLTCGLCGAGVTIISENKVSCAAEKEKGTCSHKKRHRYAEIEARVLKGLKEQLVDPDVVEEYIRAYHARMKANRDAAAGKYSSLRGEKAETERQISNLVDICTRGAAPGTLVAKLGQLENRLAELSKELAEVDAPTVVEMHPNLPALYRRKIEALQDALNGDDERRRKAIPILRSIIAKIVVTPNGQGAPALRLEGDLAEALRLAQGFRGEAAAVVVAGAGFEPTTFRL